MLTFHADNTPDKTLDLATIPILSPDQAIFSNGDSLYTLINNATSQEYIQLWRRYLKQHMSVVSFIEAIHHHGEVCDTDELRRGTTVTNILNEFTNPVVTLIGTSDTPSIPDKVRSLIQVLITDNRRILVGGNSNIDQLYQKELSLVNYANVVVYAQDNPPLHNLGNWPVNPSSLDQRQNDSTVMVAIWDMSSRGTGRCLDTYHDKLVYLFNDMIGSLTIC